MSRERRVRSETSIETEGAILLERFEQAKAAIYQAWYDSEKDEITPSQRTALIRNVYSEYSDVAPDFEELTEEVVDGEFLTVGQLIVKQARDTVVKERDTARRVREEATRASAGQKRYVRRTKAQERHGTKPRDIH